MAASLEGKYLDAATVDAIAEFLRRAEPRSQKLFIRLYRTRGIPGHPLNADFLDAVLRSMPTSERDLHWTEWIEKMQMALEKTSKAWKTVGGQACVSKRRGSFARQVADMGFDNDCVESAGPSNPCTILVWPRRFAALFELAEHVHDIDDPSIYERTLAASYGVAMALHCDANHPDFRATTLPSQACRIFGLMFKKNAPSRTTHILIRELRPTLYRTRSNLPSTLTHF